MEIIVKQKEKKNKIKINSFSMVHHLMYGYIIFCFSYYGLLNINVGKYYTNAICFCANSKYIESHYTVFFFNINKKKNLFEILSANSKISLRSLP